MRLVSDTLPTYQVAAVLEAYIRADDIRVDSFSGHVPRRMRRILGKQHAVTDIGVAEEMLELVGAQLWEVPDYNMVGKGKRRIRLRMVKCACGCGEKLLSHYVFVQLDGKHKWMRRRGVQASNPRSDGKRADRLFIHGHYSGTEEFKEIVRASNERAWTTERRAKHSEQGKAAWTDERKEAHAQRLRELHEQGTYAHIDRRKGRDFSAEGRKRASNRVYKPLTEEQKRQRSESMKRYHEQQRASA